MMSIESLNCCRLCSIRYWLSMKSRGDMGMINARVNEVTTLIGFKP